MATVTVLLLLPLFLTVLPTSQNELEITTKNGKVQGKLVSVLGGEVRAFLGIPFGKPPLGKLRFRRPEPAEGWSGVRDATTYPNACYQMMDSSFPGFRGSEMWNPNTPISEDCLYLNVWSPRSNKTQSKSSTLADVLVWIYGGGFTTGTSSLDLYDGRFLCKSEGVVVVSMNYRVGAFGFLSLTDNKNIRGNAGLMDQRLALQWVADNIAAFGGDPSKVTLFGESAGSACVGFHLISPGSNGYFQRAVMQSGSPNAQWATITQTEAGQRSKKLGMLLGCPTSPPADLEACLQDADPEKILMNQYNVFSEAAVIMLPFVPTVDGDFLPDTVEALMNSSSLPKKEIIIGLNKDEGTYFVFYGLPGFNISGPGFLMRETFLKGVATTLSNESELARQAAIFHYTDWTDEDNAIKNLDFMANLIGDHMFCAVLEFAHRYSQHGGKTFAYSFEHRSSTNPWPEWMGVIHGYEIEFVFGIPLNSSLGYKENEVNMTKRLMKHWTNFARTGDPSISGGKWPAFTPEQHEHVILNLNFPEQKTKMKAEACHFWNKLMKQIQKVSDDLQTCEKGNGIILHSNFMFLLMLLALTLNYW